VGIDREKIEEHIRGILIALGEDPNREGLIKTPARVARMYEEIFEGIGYSNDEIAEMFNTAFEDDLDITDSRKDMVIVKDIDLFSYCEHHIALMYNMKAAIAYIPNGKILGLSKIVRIADMACKRLQLQERIGSDIAEIMQKAAGTEDVAVIIEGQHACVSSRGIKNTHAVTVTTTSRGAFLTDPSVQEKLMQLYRGTAG